MLSRFSKTSLFIGLFTVFYFGNCKNSTINFPTTSFESETDILATLLNNRMKYMKDVAAYKWTNELAIEDLPREKIVIASGQKKAIALGLDTMYTRPFLEKQIELAKLIQNHWFSYWEKNGFQNEGFRDLNTVIRPELIQLGNKILAQIELIKKLSIKETVYEKGAEIFQKKLNFSELDSQQKVEFYNRFWQIIRPSSLTNNTLSISGNLEKDTLFTIQDLKNLPNNHIDTIVLKNGAGKTYKKLENAKGVRLIDVINAVTIEGLDNKTSSAFYVVCTADDGYKVVYSWNELVNSNIGEAVFILYAADNGLSESSEETLMMVSLKDIINGKRNLRDLKKIEVLRV